MHATPAQRPASAIDDGTWDVVVVGAGPAGSLAARRLARSGRRVLLLDGRRFPRDKACGDALIPDALACLERNGLLARVRALAHGAAGGELYAPSRARVPLECAMLTVPRRALDAELAAAAVESGACFAHGLVRAVSAPAPGVPPRTSGRDGAAATLPVGATVHVVGRSAPIAARLVILATGAHVGLLGGAGLLDRPAASAVAIRRYVRATHALDWLVVSFDRSILPGYAWIFPVPSEAPGARAYNVGCGIVLGAGGAESGDRTAAVARGLREMLDRFMREFPVARAVAESEVGRSPVRGAALRCALTGARGWAGGAVLATGEAIGATYPLTGEGIGKAMETAERCADAVEAAFAAGSRAPLADYPARLAAELRPRYRGYAAAERWVGVGWLTDLVLRQAARRPRVQAALTGVLTETVPPERVFSPGGLLRGLLG